MKKIVIIMMIALLGCLIFPIICNANSVGIGINSFSPTHAKTGSVVDITIIGYNFSSACTQSGLFNHDTRVSVYAKSTQVISSTEIIAHQINLSGLEATPDQWLVQVFNGSNWVGCCGSNFIIDSPINPTYSFSSYLAEGSTGSDLQTQFETWILVVNTNATSTKINMVYNTNKGPIAGPKFTMSPNTRKSINVGDTVKDWSVSTIVQSSQRVYTERSMYWNGRSAGNGSLGVNKIGQDWILPEGSTGSDPYKTTFETWILIQNPNDQAVNAQLSFITDKGAVKGPKVKITAQSRTTINVADYVPNTWSVSTEISADGNVACGRSTYWNSRHAGTSTEGTLLDNNN